MVWPSPELEFANRTRAGAEKLKTDDQIHSLVDLNWSQQTTISHTNALPLQSRKLSPIGGLCLYLQKKSARNKMLQTATTRKRCSAYLGLLTAAALLVQHADAAPGKTLTGSSMNQRLAGMEYAVVSSPRAWRCNVFMSCAVTCLQTAGWP